MSPLTEQSLHEKGEKGVFPLRKKKEENMPGTDTRDLVPTSITPSIMRDEEKLTELMKALKLHEKRPGKP
jgi:hypothetical protein